MTDDDLFKKWRTESNDLADLRRRLKAHESDVVIIRNNITDVLKREEEAWAALVELRGREASL